MGIFLSKNKQNRVPHGFVARRNRLNRSQSEPCPPSVISSHPRRSLSLNTESYIGNKVISILPGTHISFRVNDEDIENKKKTCFRAFFCFCRKEPELPDIVDATFVGPSRASGTDL